MILVILIEKSGIVDNYGDIHMNVQTIPSVGSNNQTSSSSSVRLTITENTSRTIQPIKQRSNYELWDIQRNHWELQVKEESQIL